MSCTICPATNLLAACHSACGFAAAGCSVAEEAAVVDAVEVAVVDAAVVVGAVVDAAADWAASPVALGRGGVGLGCTFASARSRSISTIRPFSVTIASL